MDGHRVVKKEPGSEPDEFDTQEHQERKRMLNESLFGSGAPEPDEFERIQNDVRKRQDPGAEGPKTKKR